MDLISIQEQTSLHRKDKIKGTCTYAHTYIVHNVHIHVLVDRQVYVIHVIVDRQMCAYAYMYIYM